MASKGYRSAGILIEIDGEREFTAQIKAIRAETKTLTKELELVQAKFSGQRNTLEALDKEYEATEKILRNLNKEHQQLVDRSTRLQNKLKEETANQKALNDELNFQKKLLANLEQYFGKDSEQYKKKAKEVEALTIEYEKSSARVADYTKELSKTRGELAENEKASFGLSGRLKVLKQALDEAMGSQDHTAKSMDKFGKVISGTEEKLDALTDAVGLQTWLGILKDVLGGASEEFEKLAAKMQECVEKYYDFETAAVSVSKTVPNLSREQAMDMINALSEVMPFSREDIASVLAQGGQYGISFDALESYAQSMLALASATNIELGDLSAVAQLASIIHTSEEEYSRLGSTLTDLGNKTRTTEKDTVHMAQTIAATASGLGMSQAEVLGLANALAATGGQARGTGTAMVRFMSDIDQAVSEGSDQMQNYARIAGMTGEQFQRAFKDNAMDAILAVLGGMDSIIDSGGTIYQIFDTLGIKNSIDKINLKNLVATYDDVVRTLDIARTAWDEDTALMTEFNNALNTNASQIQLYENALDGLKGNIGEDISENYVEPTREQLTQLIKDFNDLVDEFQEFNDDPAAYVKKRRGIERPTNVFGQTDITIPVTFDYDQSSYYKFDDYVGAESWVSQFAEALKTASGEVSPVSQMLESWMDEAGRITPSLYQGAESPVSQMLDNYLRDFDLAAQELEKQTIRIIDMYEKTFDPMERFSEKGSISAREFTKNLQSNAQKMQEYSDNLVKVLSDPRVSEAMKEYIKGLNPDEAYQLVEDFANDKDGKLIGSANEAMAKFNGAIAESSMDTGIATGEVTDEVIKALTEADLGGQGFTIGADVDDGIIKGLASRRKAVKYMVDSIASMIDSGLRTALQVNSPSKVTEKVGESVDEGLIVGMRNMEEDVAKQAARLATISANVYDGVVVGLQNGLNASVNLNTKDYTKPLNQLVKNTSRNNVVVVNERKNRTSQSAVNDLERALVRGMLY